MPRLTKLIADADARAAHFLPKLKSGEALGFPRNHWEPLTNYVEDGRHAVERRRRTW